MTELVMEKIFVCEKLNELDITAEEILNNIGSCKIVAFFGKMGAGKTTLIKAICKKLGVTDVVTSPTFAILNEYARTGGDPVYHFDFYRITSVDEAFDLGYETFFYSGNYCFIEWPEKIKYLLPENCAEIHITATNRNRQIQLIA